jgi:hypothetical protein
MFIEKPILNPSRREGLNKPKNFETINLIHDVNKVPLFWRGI